MDENFVKIANAAYRVLGLFPNGDPLKNKAKEKVLAILENLALISDVKGRPARSSHAGGASFKKEKTSAQLLEDIEVLKTYLRLAKHLGFIDNVNFLILCREYDNIKRAMVPPVKLQFRPPVENYQLKRENNASPNALARQEKILKMLAEKGQAQVSDIIKEIPDVTKRTIRRDLDELLKKGRVSRVGQFNQVFYRILGTLGQKPENKANFDRTTTMS